MSLFAQFQTFIGTIIIAMAFSCIWSFFNRIFYSKKIWIIRFPFEVILFCIFSFVYYVFLANFSDGIINIFYILAMLCGIAIYWIFYSKGFLTLFERIASSFSKTFITPIKLKIDKIHDKFKLRKKKNEKNNVKKNKSHI